MDGKAIHRCLHVLDLEKSIAFYEKALGMTEIRRMGPEDGSWTNVFMGSDASGFQLELTWNRGRTEPYDNGGRDSHLAFTVDDYEAARALHEEMGCICHVNEAMGLYFIEDPDGCWLEILPNKAEFAPQAGVDVLDAMARIAEGMCALAHGYAQAGVESVYYAALGAERRWFTDEEFARWIEPFDKLILSEIRKAGCKVFLHICKDGLEMGRYQGYGELCDVVNWGVYEAPYPVEEARKLFPGKAIMGGLANRSGVMVEGSKEELAQAARDTVARYGDTGFILGADCTLPTEIDYGRIRAIVAAVRA